MNINETKLGQVFAEISSEFDARDTQIADLQSQVGTLGPQVAALQAQVENDSTYMAQVNSERNEAVAALQAQVDSLTQQLADANAEITRLNNP